MKALLHHDQPGTKPAGVWWLPQHKSQPRSTYLNQDAYNTGARAVLGDNYDGEPLTQANWDSRVERLTESANPFHTWSVEETDDPETLLAQSLQSRPPQDSNTD